MTLAEMFMAWRLWFTRGLLKKAKRWHAKALLDEMNRLDKAEKRALKLQRRYMVEVRCAGNDWDRCWHEVQEEGLDK